MAASRRVTLSDLTAAAARRLRRESSDLANALAIYRLPSLSGRTPEALAVTPAPLRKGDKAKGAALMARQKTARGTPAAPDAEAMAKLIHADLRLANLLVENGRIGVIDFDDCGFGWFGFDFAAAVSFIETDPQLPALMAAWVEGYRSVATLDEAHAAMLPVFVMLRRMQLTAWIASHAETPTAQEMGDAFTEGTVAMADRFLST